MSGAPAPLLEATRELLCRHTPYNRMSSDALAFLISRLKLAYFAKDTLILSPGMGAVEHLHIVQRGLISSHTADSQTEPDSTLGPGEAFPVGALSASGASTKSYSAVQDTFCYLLARDDFTELRRRSPEFERFCAQALTETLKQSLAQLQNEYSRRAAEQQILARPLAELIRRAPVTCATTAPLAEALQAMRAGTVRTIVVVDSGGGPAGIFTLIDLLQRVVLAGKPLSTPIAEVMSAPAVALPAAATASEALQTMAEHGLRQLIVVDNRRVAGVVSERDLFSLQRVSMGQVTATLRSARNLDGLKRAAEDIRLLTQNLLAQGVVAEPLTRTIAALNDALSRRVIEQALGRHDVADCDWCWLALGSEGRGEQTFATDQDNALVFAGDDAAGIQRRRSQLLAFAETVNADLDRVGFPLCTGNVMASNPELCLSAEEWKEKFSAWMREPTPEALLKANIVFDFRPLYGNAALADSLRAWLHGHAPESKIFLRLLAQNALEVGPPLGLIRTFATEDATAHKGTLNLKTRGTRLFVDAARVFALAFGVAETATAARLRAAGKRLNVEERHVAATVEAFHFLQLLRLRQQDLSGGHDAANQIDPYALNEVDQRMLKEAFRQARKLQQLLQAVYQL